MSYQFSLRKAEFDEASRQMLYDFGRLEAEVARLQAENERLTAENQELREAAETAATVLTGDLEGERVSTTTRHSLVRWLNQLVADNEQRDNVPAYTEETG